MAFPRRSARLFALAAGLAVLAYTALWFWQAVIARSAVEALLARERAGGLTLTGSDLTFGGYPFGVEIRLDDAVLSGLAALPSARITAPRIAFGYHPLAPGIWALSAPRGLQIELPLPSGEVRIAAQETTADAGPRDEGGLGVDFHAGDLTVTGAGAGLRMASFRVKGDLPASKAASDSGIPAGFRLEVDGLTLPRALGPLGQVVDRIELDGQFQGDLPHEPLTEALTSWRDGGGTIELRRVHLGWGGLQLDGEGTLALDRNMQPEAAFTAEMFGWKAALDALVDGGTMKPDEAEFAKLGLALLGAAVGDAQALKAPITLQNGQIYVEKARLAHLPHIDWP